MPFSARLRVIRESVLALVTADGRKSWIGRRGEAVFAGSRAVVSWFGACLAADNDRFFLWVPVLIGCGIAAYFGLAVEPPLWPAVLGTALLAAAQRLLRYRATLALCLAALTCMALGFSAATLRAVLVSAPVLEKAAAGEMIARVIAVEGTETGSLVAILAPRSFASLPVDRLPAKVRVTIRLKEAQLAPGAMVRLRARLLPPPEPVLPGGFDYARQVWFNGLGAVGFAYTLPEEIEPPAVDMTTALATLRVKIGARIREVVGGTSGAVAAALINGERAAIPDEISEDLRAAGLFHVLSISGLHMVLFGGAVFWGVRAALALIPALALRYPIKKWAAVAALLGATFYLLISGAAVATQRAWLMIALMFVAILLDRPAISMRNVMLAAIAILLWRPESLIGASFQMSFAAVIALIAFYESDLVRRWTMSPRRGGLAAMPRLAATYVLGIALTSIVAGTATGAIAAFHFNRIAVYGLAGNMAAMPLVGVVVMPMALVALLLMPFGLDGPALWLMGLGVEWMLAVAHEVASWEGADRLVADAPLHALVLVVMGALWLSLWRETWRYLGIAPMLLGFALWGNAVQPDVLVDREGALFAVRDSGGALVLTSSRPAYTAEQWLRHAGDERMPREAARSPFVTCDAQGCIYNEPQRPVVAFPATLDAVLDDCERAEVIVAKIPIPRRIEASCGARLVIDYFDLWREGATTLTFAENGQIDVATAREHRGSRPWVQRQRKAEAQ